MIAVAVVLIFGQIAFGIETGHQTALAIVLQIAVATACLAGNRGLQRVKVTTGMTCTRYGSDIGNGFNRLSAGVIHRFRQITRRIKISHQSSGIVIKASRMTITRMCREAQGTPPQLRLQAIGIDRCYISDEIGQSTRTIVKILRHVPLCIHHMGQLIGSIV